MFRVFLFFSLILFFCHVEKGNGLSIYNEPSPSQPVGLTVGGSGGLINLPSAYTAAQGFSFGSQVIFKNKLGANFVVNVAPWHMVEFFFETLIHQDTFSSNDRAFGGNLGAKMTLWGNETMAVGVYFAFHSIGFSGSYDARFGSFSMGGQLLALFSYTPIKSLIFTLGVGKSFGDSQFYDNSVSDWDAGIGIEWRVFENKDVVLSWLSDFVNFDVRGNGVDLAEIFGGQSSLSRGNFSTVVRGVFWNILVVDVGLHDIFDSAALLINLGFHIPFSFK